MPPTTSACARRRLSALCGQLLSPLGVAGKETDHALTIEAVPGCTLGAVVRGVSLASELSPDTLAQIKKAFLEFAVLVFPAQHGLTAQQQAEFSRQFGKLEFEKMAIGNVDQKTGNVAEPGSVGYKVVLGQQAFHMDSTYMPVSAKCGILFAEKVPSWGGETEWADMRAGYAALDEATKAKIENLTSYHSAQYTGARRTGLFPRHAGGKSAKSYGGHGSAMLRPLVKVHPETGRKNLFVAAHSFGVPGLSFAESEKFLDDLVNVAAQPPRVFKHRYEPGDLVMWDNRCVLHRSRPYDMREARVLRGARVAGEPETETALPTVEEEATVAFQTALEWLKQREIWDDATRDSHIR